MLLVNSNPSYIHSQLEPENKRPVLVFIHGGGYICGEANRDYYGPEYFIKKDVVIITVQYRLGVLGKYAMLSFIKLEFSK